MDRSLNYFYALLNHPYFIVTKCKYLSNLWLLQYHGWTETNGRKDASKVRREEGGGGGLYRVSIRTDILDGEEKQIMQEEEEKEERRRLLKC